MDWAAKVFSCSLTVLAFAAMTGLSSPVMAGTTPPNEQKAQEASDIAAVPADYDPDTMELADPATPGRTTSVAVDSLSLLNAEEVGLHRDALSENLWRGVSASVAHGLLDDINSPMAIAAVRDLSAKFLTNAAKPPQGEVAGRSLLGRRVGALWNIGLADQAGNLAATATSSLVGPTLARVRGESLVMTNPAQACAEMNRLLMTGVMDLAAQIKIICAMGEEDKSAARLGLDFMREDPNSDALFIAAMDMAFGHAWPKTGVKATEIGPVHVAAFKAAAKPVPGEYLTRANAALLGALALDRDIPADQRLELAGRAAQWGLIAPKDLADIYLEVSFDAASLGDPLTYAKPGQRGQALLMRAAQDQPDPALKASFVAQAMKHANHAGQSVLAAKVFKTLLDAIPAGSLMDMEANRAMAAAHVALGQWKVAAAWLNPDAAVDTRGADAGNGVQTAQAGGPTPLVASDAMVAPKPVVQWGNLWPQTAIRDAKLAEGVDEQGLRIWLDSQTGNGSDKRKAIVLAALNGLGVALPDWAWNGIDATSSVSLARFTQLQQAALDARTGAVLALVAGNLGVADGAEVSPLWLSESLSALAVVGMADQARAIAAEVVWAQGL